MRRQRVLIVEDSATLVHVLQRFFDEMGLESDYAYTGKEFSKKLKGSHFDLMLVDITLPDTNGHKIVKRIRNFSKDIPIIIITNDGSLLNEIESFRGGANLFHEKPITYPLLKEQVLSFLNKKKGLSVKRIGGVVVDTARRVVKKEDKKIFLTHQEFTLLEILLNNPMKILTRAYIMSLFDNQNCLYEGTSVDTAVCRIRRKLGEKTGDSMIETVRGVGYRLRLNPQEV
jgi:DNA-binding response OmpR family regulator